MLNQLVFSFDVTGSMSSCIGLVRRQVEQTVNELFSTIPNLEIGVIAHGDYCDGPNWLRQCDVTKDQQKICDFIRRSPSKSGGDLEEAYESVLHEVQSMAWKTDARKAFVLIADDVPHKLGEWTGGKRVNFDWKEQGQKLSKQGIKIYTIQCLGFSYANGFYEELARIGGGCKLELNQFAHIVDLLKAVCYNQADQLPDFINRLQSSKTIDISLLRNMDILLGKKPREFKKSTFSSFAVHPARFQVIPVDRNSPIRKFVEDNGLYFKKGRGFYEFTKPVVVQDYKEVIIQDKSTGEMFSGPKAREILGIPVGKTAKVKPGSGAMSNYIGFIQSTSVNRKLLAGTRFLYEVNEHSV